MLDPAHILHLETDPRCSFLPLQVLPYVTPGSTKFYNASLVVDVAGILGFVASPVSAEKAGLIRIPLGWSGFGYWG